MRWLVVVALGGCDAVFDLVPVVPDARVDAASYTCPDTYALQLPSSPTRYRISEISETLTTWDAAAADCADDLPGHTHLPVIDADVERRELAAQAPGSIWIGLTDRLADGTFVWVTASDSAIPMTIPPWGPGQPDNQGGQQHCVRIEGPAGAAPTFYDDAECTARYPYACECDDLADDPTRY